MNCFYAIPSFKSVTYLYSGPQSCSSHPSSRCPAALPPAPHVLLLICFHFHASALQWITGPLHTSPSMVTVAYVFASQPSKGDLFCLVLPVAWNSSPAALLLFGLLGLPFCVQPVTLFPHHIAVCTFACCVFFCLRAVSQVGGVKLRCTSCFGNSGYFIRGEMICRCLRSGVNRTSRRGCEASGS